MAKFGPGRYEFMRGKRNYSAGLQAQVEAIVADVEDGMLNVVQQSTLDVINIAQTPGISKASYKADIDYGVKFQRGKRNYNVPGPAAPTSKGGRMRVDTGFLRASGQLSLTGMPTGPTRGDPDQKYEFADQSVKTQIFNEIKLGSTIFFGWTAAYAKYREAFDGFLEGAIQQWPRIVAQNVDRVVGKIR